MIFPKLKERYSTLITFSLNEMKLAIVVDALRKKHEAAIPRSVGIDILAKAKVILREEKLANTTPVVKEVMEKLSSSSTTFYNSATVPSDVIQEDDFVADLGRDGVDNSSADFEADYQLLAPINDAFVSMERKVNNVNQNAPDFRGSKFVKASRILIHSKSVAGNSVADYPEVEVGQSDIPPSQKSILLQEDQLYLGGKHGLSLGTAIQASSK